MNDSISDLEGCSSVRDVAFKIHPVVFEEFLAEAMSTYKLLEAKTGTPAPPFVTPKPPFAYSVSPYEVIGYYDFDYGTGMNLKHTAEFNLLPNFTYQLGPDSLAFQRTERIARNKLDPSGQWSDFPESANERERLQLYGRLNIRPARFSLLDENEGPLSPQYPPESTNVPRLRIVIPLSFQDLPIRFACAFPDQPGAIDDDEHQFPKHMWYQLSAKFKPIQCELTVDLPISDSLENGLWHLRATAPGANYAKVLEPPEKKLLPNDDTPDTKQMNVWTSIAGWNLWEVVGGRVSTALNGFGVENQEDRQYAYNLAQVCLEQMKSMIAPILVVHHVIPLLRSVYGLPFGQMTDLPQAHLPLTPRLEVHPVTSCTDGAQSGVSSPVAETESILTEMLHKGWWGNFAFPFGWGDFYKPCSQPSCELDSVLCQQQKLGEAEELPPQPTPPGNWEDCPCYVEPDTAAAQAVGKEFFEKVFPPFIRNFTKIVDLDWFIGGASGSSAHLAIRASTAYSWLRHNTTSEEIQGLAVPLGAEELPETELEGPFKDIPHASVTVSSHSVVAMVQVCVCAMFNGLLAQNAQLSIDSDGFIKLKDFTFSDFFGGVELDSPMTLGPLTTDADLVLKELQVSPFFDLLDDVDYPIVHVSSRWDVDVSTAADLLAGCDDKSFDVDFVISFGRGDSWNPRVEMKLGEAAKNPDQYHIDVCSDFVDDQSGLPHHHDVRNELWGQCGQVVFSELAKGIQSNLWSFFGDFFGAFQPSRLRLPSPKADFDWWVFPLYWTARPVNPKLTFFLPKDIGVPSGVIEASAGAVAPLPYWALVNLLSPSLTQFSSLNALEAAVSSNGQVQLAGKYGFGSDAQWSDFRVASTLPETVHVVPLQSPSHRAADTVGFGALVFAQNWLHSSVYDAVEEMMPIGIPEVGYLADSAKILVVGKPADELSWVATLDLKPKNNFVFLTRVLFDGFELPDFSTPELDLHVEGGGFHVLYTDSAQTSPLIPKNKFLPQIKEIQYGHTIIPGIKGFVSGIDEMRPMVMPVEEYAVGIMSEQEGVEPELILNLMLILTGGPIPDGELLEIPTSNQQGGSANLYVNSHGPNWWDPEERWTWLLPPHFNEGLDGRTPSDSMRVFEWYYVPPLQEPPPTVPLPSFPNRLVNPSFDIVNQIGENILTGVGCRVREYFGEWKPMPPSFSKLVKWNSVILTGRKIILEEGLSPVKLVESKLLKRIETPTKLPDFKEPQEPKAFEGSLAEFVENAANPSMMVLNQESAKGLSWQTSQETMSDSCESCTKSGTTNEDKNR